jgi:hypothetical protein
MTLVIPTSAELREIQQVLIPRLTADRLIFKYMPMESVDSHILEWEQKDNFIGLQQLRGLDGAPAHVRRIGASRYALEPGVYGDFVKATEAELTMRRKLATFGTPIDLSDLVLEFQQQLLVRRLDRIEYIGWQLLATGTFSVSSPTGIVHTDRFPLQTYTAAVPWATSATATPLADLRGVELLSRGMSTSFGSDAALVMNRITFNSLVSNMNQNDLAGRRVTALLSPLNLEEINKILLGENLPQIEIYDQGYLQDGTGTFAPFIPNNTAIVIGRRRTGAVAEYLFTRNAQNPDFAPGPYSKVVVDEDETPIRVEVHDGHNGGPAIYFPGSIVVITC